MIDALADTRVVLVHGSRQVGKPTLVTELLGLSDAVTRRLDDPQMPSAARYDPNGFVTSGRLLVIDEIERGARTAVGDQGESGRRPRPGLSLLTGSAKVLTMRARNPKRCPPG